MTRTVPLLCASTWALSVTAAPAATWVSSIGATRNRCRFAEVKSTRTRTAPSDGSAGSTDAGRVLRIVRGNDNPRWAEVITRWVTTILIALSNDSVNVRCWGPTKRAQDAACPRQDELAARAHALRASARVDAGSTNRSAQVA